MEKPIGYKEQGTKQSKINGASIILGFTIAALSMMFLALTVAYLFSKESWTWGQFRFPKVFLISTIVIVLSSWTLQKGIHSLEKDHLDQLNKWIKRTLFLGLLFCLLQVCGWWELNRSGIFFNGTPDGSYLYLISGLHALHLVAGLMVLLALFVQSYRGEQDPVKSLMYLENSAQKKKMKLLSTYWHFVDILWLYLLLFFLFNHL